MNTLFFTTSTTGHHLEYIHHLYEATLNHEEENFIFLLPESFNEVKSKFKWENKNHLKFIYLTNEELLKCNSKNYFTSAFNKSLTLKKYIIKYNIQNLFLITIVHCLPFLPFILPSSINIFGIIYRIFPYEWEKLTLIQKIKDLIETIVMAKSTKIRKIFVLNDNSAACFFNKKYNTNKFIELPDPILPSNHQVINLKQKLDIDTNKTVYLHFGAMNKRKGTLTLLDSIKQLPNREKSICTFIFAGKIDKSIEVDFYKKYNQIKNETQIIVFNEFCSYEMLSDLCYSSDYIVIPYQNTSFSSGVLGYAAQYNKPVIGPSHGLLGKLIKRNRLGTVIKENTSIYLSEAICNKIKIKSNSKIYISKNCIENFQKVIFTNIFNKQL